jgi:hypothetical protein
MAMRMPCHRGCRRIDRKLLPCYEQRDLPRLICPIEHRDWISCEVALPVACVLEAA